MDRRPLADKLRITWLPVLLLVGAHALDVATTILALKQGAVESNPFLAGIAHDWRALAWIKLAVVAVVVLGVLVDPMRSLWVPGSIWFMTVVSWAIVGWNLWGYTRFTGDGRLMPLYWGLLALLVVGVGVHAAWSLRGRTFRFVRPVPAGVPAPVRASVTASVRAPARASVRTPVRPPVAAPSILFDTHAHRLPPEHPGHVPEGVPVAVAGRGKTVRLRRSLRG